MRIKNQDFAAEDIDLDGNIFENCKFSKSNMVFRGRAPVSFDTCTFEDVRWEFRDAASLTTSLMRAMSESTGDYGRELLINTFPALKDWVKPEKLAGKKDSSNG